MISSCSDLKSQSTKLYQEGCVSVGRLVTRSLRTASNDGSSGPSKPKICIKAVLEYPVRWPDAFTQLF